MSMYSRIGSSIKYVFSNRRAAVVGLVAAGLVAVTGGAALATRSASDHFATAAFDKLGGDSNEILNTIADKVVEKLSKKGGTFDSTQAQVVDQLAAMAGKKFGKVDVSKLLKDLQGQVVGAGLDKLDGISTDQIVAQVTASLIAQASTLLDNVDVEKLAKGAISDVIKSLNLEKLVKQKIDSIDVEKLVSDAVAKQMKASGGTNPLTSLLGSLMSR
jgi:uncharacterized protein with von Willebrand factor type A (vWA) domain